MTDDAATKLDRLLMSGPIRGAATSPVEAARMRADEEREDRFMRACLSAGLDDAQIADVRRLIDRVGSELIMPRSDAHGLDWYLIDFDDDMRRQFERACIDGGLPVRHWPDWLDTARGIMTTRKEADMRRALGLA